MGNTCAGGDSAAANSHGRTTYPKPPGNPTNPGNCGTTMKARKTGDECPPIKEGQLRQYSMRFCPYSQRVRLVIAHKNINVEFVNINLIEKPEWYFDKNPKGTVPCIEQDDKLLWDSAIVAEYLDSMHPGPLKPSDPFQWGRQQLIFRRYDAYCVESYNTFFHGAPEEADGAKQRLTEGLQFINDKYLENGKTFFSGDKVGLLDYLIWPHIERFPALKVFIGFDAMPEGKYKGIDKWKKQMMNTPGVKITFNPVETHVTFGQGLASGSPPFDLHLMEEQDEEQQHDAEQDAPQNDAETAGEIQDAPQEQTEQTEQAQQDEQ